MSRRTVEDLALGDQVAAIYLDANVSAWRSFEEPRAVRGILNPDGVFRVYLKGVRGPFICGSPPRLSFEVIE